MVKQKPSFPLWAALLLLLLAVIVPYSNTLDCSFQFDDESAITANSAIQKGSLSQIVHAFPHRFIGYFTFALNYRLHQLSVKGYHLVNIAIHLLASLLVFALVSLLLKTPAINRNNPPPAVPAPDRAALAAKRGKHAAKVNVFAPPAAATTYSWVPLFAALVFAVHPVQSQAVTYIVQRLASLAALWYLAAMAAYVRGRLLAVSGRGTPVIWYGASFIAGVIGLFTKETTATLPLALVMIEGFFFCERITDLRRRAWPLAPFLLLLLVIPASYFLNVSTSARSVADLVPGDQQAISRVNYLLTQFNVVRLYVRLVFIPIAQNLDYNIPVTASLFSGFTLPSFLLLAALVVLGVRLFRTNRLLSFGILFFFLALSVESSIIPIWDVCFEHRLYLPLLGFAIAVVLVIRKLFRDERLSALIMAGVVVTFAILTYQRNQVWKTPITLWEDVVKKSPDKARPHNNLGMAYADKQMMQEAYHQYQRAIELRPAYDDAHYNLGNLYRETGKMEKAVEEYRIVLAKTPEYVKAWLNLGVAYYNLNKPVEAASAYQRVMRLDPKYPDAYYNMGNLFLRSGLPDSAIDYYQRAIGLRPAHPGSFNNMGVAFMQRNMSKEGIAAFRRALEITPDFKDARDNLRDALGGKR